jgi:hypothetical protein
MIQNAMSEWYTGIVNEVMQKIKDGTWTTEDFQVYHVAANIFTIYATDHHRSFMEYHMTRQTEAMEILATIKSDMANIAQ